ncbi:hypothetical protein IWX90DRAFT_431727 [Phyllosticta citrichinensis]|uniref:Uncharacterized protein n=1 Tax=Phyllosticta citrichinensis TaxID=1130410 RepID=A0ABR1XXI2_9PEZI
MGAKNGRPASLPACLLRTNHPGQRWLATGIFPWDERTGASSCLRLLDASAVAAKNALYSNHPHHQYGFLGMRLITPSLLPPSMPALLLLSLLLTLPHSLTHSPLIWRSGVWNPRYIRSIRLLFYYWLASEFLRFGDPILVHARSLARPCFALLRQSAPRHIPCFFFFCRVVGSRVVGRLRQTTWLG